MNYSPSIAINLYSGYRFGFNGQEKDDEITGQTGSVYTAMFWEYDARIGRRWNIDPKPNPSISSYATFANNPIFYSDPFGDSLKTKISRSLRKELGITRKEAKNYTPPKIAKNYEQEYGMCVEVRNGYLHYTGESDNQPSTFSPTAKDMWKEELGEKYKSNEKLVLSNKGYDHNTLHKTSLINLNNYGDDLSDLTSEYSAPNDINFKRTWNLGRVIEHEVLGHSVMRLKDWTTAYDLEDVDGYNEYLKGKNTALKQVNSFRIEMGLQDYQRLFYGIKAKDGYMIFFGNPTKPLTPIYILSY